MNHYSKTLSLAVCFMLLLNVSRVNSTELTLDSHVTKETERTQQIGVLKGTVLDENGEPVIGANVVVKGTTNGTITDLDGTFSLSVKPTDILSVSYIGYLTSEVPVNNRSILQIQLQIDALNLEDVIVTAYGTTKKASFTGSATVIGSEAFERAQPANLSQGLQGLSPGLTVINNSGAPGANATIMIRGLGSFSADNDPLYVVDGIPFSGDLNLISPSDIESITVLKDASSTALYGSRAANGVLMITTKKGKSGKTKINVRANWGTSDFAVKFPEKVSPERQYELTFEGLYNDATDFMGYTDSEARQYAHDRVTRIYWYEENKTLADGTVRKYLSDWNTDYPVGLDGKIKPDAKRLYNWNAYDESFKHRLKQDYSVDLSGGMGENNTYFASFSMLDDKGIYVGEQYKRHNLRFSLHSKVTNWLSFDNSISYVTSTNYNVSPPINAFRAFPNVYSAYIWDHDANDYYVSPYTGGRALDVGEQGRNWWTGWSAFGYLVESTKNKTDNVFAKTTANLTILPYLTYRISYGYDYIQTLNQWNRSPERGTVLNTGLGAVQRDGSRYVAQTFNHIMTFDKTFGDHHLNVLAGSETYQWRTDYWGAYNNNLALVSMNQISSASGDPSAWSSQDNYRLVSVLSRIEYDYMNKYYISASFRSDGSSRFHPDNRWGTFWSLGGSWRISQEAFMANTRDWLSNLKLKVSYGEVGNDRINSLYAYQALYETKNYYSNSGVALSQFATPALKWETNIQLNGGLEFTLWNKLDVGFEVYKRKSKDLLMEQPLASSLGKTSYWANVGDIENIGWELDLKYHAIKTRDFNWMINFNSSSFKNKVTSLPTGEIIEEGGRRQIKVGGSLYDIYAPLWAGVDPETGRNTWYKVTRDDDGNIIDQELTSNRNDVIDVDQYVKQGTTLPKVYGSFTNFFQYKDFDLSLMWYYSFGAKYYDNYWASATVPSGSNAFTIYAEDRWQNPGDVTSVPKIYSEQAGNAYSGSYSTQYVFKNNYLRLRNITLGYNVPKTLLKKCGVDNLRFFFIAENLFTTGKAQKHGTDPEYVGYDGIIKDYEGLPARKTFNFGLNIQF